ncbi:hypothetical protein T4C_3954 [Trichinella pseudospiralis]|uniref:Uncharacterized protein n=1 Tax=Trichinella pseudospiralis TaxID=6337 RepID=A0A0V1G7X6_TRIPS|nr:hypothetical protein T4C_3954 [Trichinella pseudospiralis]
MGKNGEIVCGFFAFICNYASSEAEQHSIFIHLFI